MKILRPALAATLAAGAATALAMAVGVPTASADSTTTSVTVPDQYIRSNDTQLSSVSPMHAGDCSMYASLSLSRPGPSGITGVQFAFTTLTSKTSNFDQWHNSWKFLDSNRQQVGAVGTIDGLRMPRVNVGYFGEIDTTTSMTQSQWASIKYVQWTGDC